MITDARCHHVARWRRQQLGAVSDSRPVWNRQKSRCYPIAFSPFTTYRRFSNRQPGSTVAPATGFDHGCEARPHSDSPVRTGQPVTGEWGQANPNGAKLNIRLPPFVCPSWFKVTGRRQRLDHGCSLPSRGEVEAATTGGGLRLKTRLESPNVKNRDATPLPFLDDRAHEAHPN